MGARVTTSSSRNTTRYAINLCGKLRKRTELPALCGRPSPDLRSEDAPEPRDAVSAYERLRRLGEGAYGQVYEACNRYSGERVALKRMHHEGRPGEKEVGAETLREVLCLRRLASSAPGARHVAQLLGVEQDKRGVSLVLELCVEDLRSVLKRDKGLPVSRVKRYAKQLLTGVAFLHSRRILHRDLKPHNVLVDFQGDLKIADFGLARPLEQDDLPPMTREVVTLWYRCPELLLGLRQYGSGVDTWSVGCIIAEMALGKPLFKGDCEIGQVMRIFQTLGTPTEATYPRYFKLPYASHNFPKWPTTELDLPLSSSLLAVVRGLLRLDPDQRLAARKALRSPAFGLEDARHFPSLD